MNIEEILKPLFSVNANQVLIQQVESRVKEVLNAGKHNHNERRKASSYCIAPVLLAVDKAVIVELKSNIHKALEP
jgi:hypothetical protein